MRIIILLDCRGRYNKSPLPKGSRKVRRDKMMGVWQWFQMWELKIETIPQLWSSGSLPPITYDSLLTVVVTLLVGHRLIKMMLQSWFEIDKLRHDPKAAALEYSPFYHLTIVILVLSEIDWNMFDLAVWALTYIGTGLLRNALFSIKLERETLLSTFTYEFRLVRLLNNSKLLGAILSLVSLVTFIALHLFFVGINLKVVNVLAFPFMMLCIDGAFLFLVSATCQKDLLVYFNHNINAVLPTYKLELIDKIAGNSVRVWHYYNLIRFFLKTLLQRVGILEYMWIFSVINAGLAAVRTLYNSIGKYRNYNKLMARFDRLFRRTTSAPDQNCTICLTELLNCQELAVCGHKFHYRCLLEWMQTKMHCPICRAPIEL